MSDNCNHPTCVDSPTCRRAKKPKKVYVLKRTPIKKRAYKLRPFSKKREKINKEQYGPESRAFVAERPVCELRILGVCTKVATGVHHVKGRIGKLLMDKKWWKISCNPCNLWVENNSKEAAELGHKKSKHN